MAASDTTLPDSPLLGWGTPDELLALEPLNNHSIAYEASRIIKTGPGVLFGFTVYSSRTSSQFIQLFDSNTLPADAAIPAWVVTIAATADREFAWIPPRTFGTGIVICNSSTGPTKTIGSADCYFDAQFL